MTTVAIQMDPITSINPHRDTTLLLGVEAARRGYQIYYYTTDALACVNGRVMATARPVTLRMDPANYYTEGDPVHLDLHGVDVVLMRQDPPFNMAYVTATYLLERLRPKVKVVNDPAAVRNHPEKVYPLEFPQFTPSTLISADMDAIRAFHKECGEMVLKPLYGYAGLSVFHVRKQDDNLEALLETLFAHSKEPVIAQAFLPQVRAEDMRIILLDGKVCGGMGRIPAEGEIRANFRAGGSPAKVTLSKRQQEIGETVARRLKQDGILFAGIDVIGDYLIEINITCPTGMQQMNRLNGTAMHETFWDAVEKL